MRVPIDAIAGASMGAVIGGLRAEGMSADEIAETFRSVDWMDAFTDAPTREDRSFRRKSDDETFLVNVKLGVSAEGLVLPPGAKEGEKLRLLLDRYTVRAAGIEKFDDLPIPFRAVASDLVTGETVVLDSGSLAEALRASVSIPALLAPVEVGGRILIDGGLVANLPVDVARGMGVDVIIAVDISSPLLTREEVASVIGVTKQLAGFLTVRNVQEQRAKLTARDVLIEPALGSIATLSFENSESAIAAGEAATLAMRDRLAALALSEADYAAWSARALPPALPPPAIAFVRAETDSKLNSATVAARVRQSVGAPLDAEQVGHDALEVYGLGVFQQVSWRLVEEASGHGVLVSAQRRTWGPGYMQFGLGFEANAEGDNGFRIGAAYTLTVLNRLGGEWRTELQVGDHSLIASELHQPLSLRMKYFFNPSLWASRSVTRLYEDNDDARADERQTAFGMSLDVGRELANWGEIRTGIRRSGGESEIVLGDPTIEQGGFDTGALFARFSFDELDSLKFPHHGVFGFVEYAASRSELGADQTYDRLQATVLGAATRKRETFVGSLRLVDTFAGQPTFPERVALGGFLNLSGFRRDQITGDDLGLLRFVWYHRLGNSKLWPTQVGISAELGNAWANDEAPTLESLRPATATFVGYDSPLGPVYFGIGWAEEGRTALYFSLGRSF